MASTFGSTDADQFIRRGEANHFKSFNSGKNNRNAGSLWKSLSAGTAPAEAIVQTDFFRMSEQHQPVGLQESLMALELMNKVMVGPTAVVSTS